MTVRALGKIILLGEHAVVHGHPALAGAIDRGVAIDVAPADRLRLRVPAWGIDVAAGDDHPVARALAAIAGALGGAPAVRLDGEADLPAAAGLGSSAATSVAIARALLAARGEDAAVERVITAASAGERCFHGNPSGVDVELAARGGIGLYRRGLGLAAIEARPLGVVVGLSGEPRQTAAMVARVAEQLAATPAETSARLARLGQAARDGAAILASAAPDLVGLGALFADAHRVLRELGLSTAGLDALVDDAVAAGALGAKLTGAGGGGAVVALAPDREDAVLDAWRRRGRVAFACLVGAHP